MTNKLIQCHNSTKNRYIIRNTTYTMLLYYQWYQKEALPCGIFKYFWFLTKNNGKNWDQMIRNSSWKNVWQKCIGIPNWLHGNNYRLTLLCLHFRFQKIQLKLSSLFSPIYLCDRFFGYKIHPTLSFIAWNVHFLVKT